MSNNNRKIRTINEEQAIIMTGLKFRSFQEYLAARSLFHNNYLDQAVILSNTCLEKQMKAAMIGANLKIRKIHNTGVLLSDFQKVLPNIADKLNIKYLKRISRIYDTRYFDYNSKGLNYFISRNHYISELDRSFSLLYKASKILRPGEDEADIKISDAETTIEDFYSNNYILQNIDRSKLFDGEDVIIATVVLPNFEVISVIIKGPIDEFYNDFERDGIRVDGNTLHAIMP